MVLSIAVAFGATIAMGGDREEEMRQDPDYEEKMARASATPDRSKAPDPALVPPPPDLPPLLRRDGFFRITAWDDRHHMSEAERSANPLERPGAQEFAACLEGYGFPKIDAQAPVGLITDDEVQAVVDAVNRDGPFVVTDGPQVHYAPKESSEQFLDCALTHLRL